MPTPIDTVLSSHSAGLAFTFNGLSSRIKTFEASNSSTPKEMTHLGQTAGSNPIYKKMPLVEGAEIKVEFFGNAVPTRGTKATIAIPAACSPTGTATSMKAICTQASVKASRGEFVSGSATFKLSGA